VLVVLLVAVPAGLGVVAWRRAQVPEDDPLAEARLAVGTRSADARLEHLRRERPGDAEVHFLSARQARLAGRPADAAAHLERAARLGWPAVAVERERWLFLAREDYGAVRPELERLLATDPADAELLLAAGEGELRSGQAGRAEELAGGVLARDPRNARALHLRGAARLRARRLDEARKDLAAALEAGPDSLEAGAVRLALATCLLDAGEFDHALEHFRVAREEGPSNPTAHFGFGRAAAFLGRLDEAEAAFKKTLELLPGHVDTLLALALLAEERSDLARAVGYLEKAEAHEPDRAETHARLAKLLAALGRADRARQHEARFRALTESGK
jgi:tetratricopeptide (TPR) repeat protein